MVVTPPGSGTRSLRAGASATMLPIVRRNTLWIGFAAVLVPLAVLLLLQYRWLTELDLTSTLAHRATLDNYLEGVTGEVRYFYRSTGERALNLPSATFTQNLFDRAARHFGKKCILGARRLFVVSFVPGGPKEPLFYDPATASLRPSLPTVAAATATVSAVEVAIAPWRTLAASGAALERPALAVDERDPAHRMLLNPITDDAAHVVGVAGMILDEDYFRQRVLPAAIRRSVPTLASREQNYDPIVTVRDRHGRTMWSSEEHDAKETRTAAFAGAAPFEVQKAFWLVFTDWRIGLRSRHGPPAQWARSTFKLNLALSAALAAALLAGLLLAMRGAAREVALSRMKTDFVSNVSHELRTPLASIRVFGELLRMGRVDSPQKVRDYGEYIEAESRRLTQLIHNILDFARIESGRKSYELVEGDLGEVVGDTLRTFAVRLRQSGFDLAYQPPPTPLPPLRFDAAALAQAMSNLLDNAVKYAGEGRQITVSLGREGHEAVLSVRDQGIGIARDQQGKIFDRFHRVSTGLVHDVKGSGLGLAIVRHIAEAHGGRVSVESRPGQGSTFSIHLPLPRLRAAAPVLLPGDAAAATASGPYGSGS
jgi:signal transduction histidine kinase